MLRWSILALLATNLGASAGCDRDSSIKPPPAGAPTGLPIEVKLDQRSTRALAIGARRFAITIDDITRGQVMVTMLRSDQSPLLGPISMRPGERAPFSLDSKNYTLELRNLINTHTEGDSATFVLRVATRVTEAEKIETLLQFVAHRTDVMFIRNGETHTPSAAAAHLRNKLGNARDQTRTAREFIDQVAWKSSTTGQPYQIRYEDGRTRELRDELSEELTRIETGVADSQPASGG